MLFFHTFNVILSTNNKVVNYDYDVFLFDMMLFFSRDSDNNALPVLHEEEWTAPVPKR